MRWFGQVERMKKVEVMGEEERLEWRAIGGESGNAQGTCPDAAKDLQGPGGPYTGHTKGRPDDMPRGTTKCPRCSRPGDPKQRVGNSTLGGCPPVRKGLPRNGLVFRKGLPKRSSGKVFRKGLPPVLSGAEPKEGGGEVMRRKDTKIR